MIEIILNIFETCDNMNKYFHILENQNINWHNISAFDPMVYRILLTAYLFIQKVDLFKSSLILHLLTFKTPS